MNKQDDPVEVNLHLGDCLEVMPEISTSSVGMVLADLPYGTTGHKWDSPVPLDSLWRNYNRVCVSNAAILLFGVMPFTAGLWQSNPQWWRYEYVWRKNGATRFLDANSRPLLDYENIEVFYQEQPTFNPQKYIGPRTHSRGQAVGKLSKSELYSNFTLGKSDESGMKFPRLTIDCDKVPPSLIVHPSQKPIDLLMHFVATYTNPGDTVLDNTMGAGSTGVACVRLGRRFIGIERDDQYFSIAQKRIEQAKQQPALLRL